MQTFTDYGQNAINNLAQRYGVSNDAVITMLYAVMNGNGTMAQFNHPELGGGGQWMQGGMTMVGDMFNYGLKAKVDGLCVDLANLLGSQQPAIFMPSTRPQGNRNWWPDDLGIASSTGGQNNVRYAYFPTSCRLAVDINGQVSIYNTLDHQIGGVSQQQGNNSSLTFSSQYGTVHIEQLPLISVNGVTPAPPPMQQTQPPAQPPMPAPAVYQENRSNDTSGNDIFALIERLADLKQKGIINDDEFATKKAELLQRL